MHEHITNKFTRLSKRFARHFFDSLWLRRMRRASCRQTFIARHALKLLRARAWPNCGGATEIPLDVFVGMRPRTRGLCRCCALVSTSRQMWAVLAGVSNTQMPICVVFYFAVLCRRLKCSSALASFANGRFRKQRFCSLQYVVAPALHAHTCDAIKLSCALGCRRINDRRPTLLTQPSAHLQSGIFRCFQCDVRLSAVHLICYYLSV